MTSCATKERYVRSCVVVSTAQVNQAETTEIACARFEYPLQSRYNKAVERIDHRSTTIRFDLESVTVIDNSCSLLTLT